MFLNLFPFLFCISVLLTLNLSHATELAQTHPYKIVLDPGHGGVDLGATRDSFIESKIVYSIAIQLRESLIRKSNAKKHHITVVLTRDGENDISLKDRVEMANNIGAQLFVSLHANTSSAKWKQGMEFYFNTQKMNSNFKVLRNSPKTSASEVITQIKQDFALYEKTENSLLLGKTLLDQSREMSEKGIIKRAPFYVIEHTRMPSILIELGFISNRREAKKLTNEDYQLEVADRLATAILEFKEKSDKKLAL